MTGPRIEVPQKQPPHPFSPEAFDAAQPTGITRGLSPEEFDQAQGMTPTQLKAWRLPPITEAIKFAPRDATTTPRPTPSAPAGKLLAPFDIKDPSTYANPLLRQLVNPALENPFETAAMGVAPFAAAGVAPAAGLAVGGTMMASMAYQVAKYGWRKAHELQMSPEDRAKSEADPERVSGESAAVQALMLGLGPLVHVGVKGARGFDLSSGMIDARALMADAGQMRITNPHVVSDFASSLEHGAASADAYARVGNQPARPKGLETITSSRVGAGAQSAEGLIVPERVTPGRVQRLDTQSTAALMEEVSASRAADAARIARENALRPRRRAAGTPAPFFESDQGAEVLGMQAARHSLPSDANPYHPASTMAEAWDVGHGAATESYPEGFSMGGALTDNRIPGAGEIPKVAKGIEGLQQSLPVEVPEGATPETAALAAAIKPSPFRGHSTESLAEAALDAQAEIEAAQTNMQMDGEASMQYDESHGLSISDQTPRYANKGETLKRAVAKMAKIEREFALRGVSGNDLADVMQSAKELRLEREGMAQDASLSGHMGDDPFGLADTPKGSGAASPLAAVEGTGDVRTRGLAAGVERKALANKLDAGLGDLPEYRQISMADQSSRAIDLIANDPSLARRVALGEVPAPDGLLPESVFVAVENKAISEGDVATIRDLATGKLTSEATTMGQRIRALGERDPESPIAAIQSVINTRAKGVKNVPKATMETVAEIHAQLKGVKVTKDAWAAFIESLRC